MRFKSEFYIAASLATYCLLVFYYQDFVADDAYIVGRYAQNAAAGLGLVFNEGEFVSALTSPFHGLISLALALIHPDPVAAYRMLATTFPLLGFAYVVAIVRLKPGQLALFSVIALTSPFLALWARGGLETPILMGLLTAFGGACLAVTRSATPSTSLMMQVGLLAGLAVLTRYDSVIALLPPVVLLAAWHWRDRRTWMAAAIGAAPLLGWLIFAQLYFGSVFPTSAFLKLSALTNPFVDSAVTVINFVALSGLLLILPMIWRGVPRSGRPAAMAVAAIVSALLLTLYAFKASGQHMMFGYRFFVPYLGLAGLALALTIGRRAYVAATLVLSMNLIMAERVANRGMTPTILISLPFLGEAFPEMTTMTVNDYARLIDTRRTEAGALSAHWQRSGSDEQPRIFLYTGGIGYFLPDFYVYETLVSYRTECPERGGLGVLGAHYVQDIEVLPVNKRMVAIRSLRTDFEAKPVTDIPIHLYHDTRSRFFFGPDPVSVRLPAMIDESCPADDSTPLFARLGE